MSALPEKPCPAGRKQPWPTSILYALILIAAIFILIEPIARDPFR